MNVALIRCPNCGQLSKNIRTSKCGECDKSVRPIAVLPAARNRVHERAGRVGVSPTIRHPLLLSTRRISGGQGRGTLVSSQPGSRQDEISALTLLPAERQTSHGLPKVYGRIP